jgi:hypothetical protein
MGFEGVDHEILQFSRYQKWNTILADIKNEMFIAGISQKPLVDL